MDSKVFDLLQFIPPEADYAADASDLDPEDISEERIKGVLALLDYPDNYTVYTAAKLLTNWGREEGLLKLEELEKSGEGSGYIYHRLYGYDDTRQYTMRALIRFWAVRYDNGEGVYVQKRIFSLLSLLIEKSNAEEFQISSFLKWMEDERQEEYVPCLKKHLESIIDHPDMHRWKIYDALQLMLKFDTSFVYDLLNKKNKTIDDFCFTNT
jgi:hypothetical protein